MTTCVSDFCRLDRRKRAIVDAARTLFIEQGYERTTVGDIVEKAGGSLSTVYKVFGSKDGLLEAVVFEKAGSGEAIINRTMSQGGSPAAVLHRLTEELRAYFLDPEMVALVRIVISRSIEDRNFAQLFYERTATRTDRALARMFAQWQQDGVEMVGDPEMLAQIFLDLIVSDLHVEAILHGSERTHSPERVRARTEFFLAGTNLADR